MINMLNTENKIFKDILKLKDIENEVDRITVRLKQDILGVLNRNGAVVGISGGIDSSVTLALAVRALGADRVLGIMLPERESSDESKEFALKLAARFNVRTIEENITRSLEGFNCYQRRDEAVCSIFPYFNPVDYKMKIGINKSGVNQNLPPVFSITIVNNEGKQQSKLLPIKEYLQIVASSNFKQRCRMSMLYYHAERMYYAMLGTPNKHEVEQGFFVKHGDGAADIMPIAHLYKSQVYQLAEHLGVPQEIINRTPTTDTYTAEQTQEEFFFQMPYYEMDIIWYGMENDIAPSEIGTFLGISTNEIELLYKNVRRKQVTTEYLRRSPIKY